MGLARQIRRLRKRREAVAAKKRRKALIEPLEPRLLLSDFTYSALAGVAIDATLSHNDATQELQLIDNTDQSVLHSQALNDTDAVFITGADQDDKLTVDFTSPFSVPNGIKFTDGSTSGGDTLEVVGKANEWHITGSNRGDVGGPGVIEFLGIDNLMGGADADRFVFEIGGGLDGSIEGGAGTDTVQGADSANAWQMTGPDAGALNGQIFSGIENLAGGSNQDDFVLSDSAGVTGTIDGGGGDDTLDYSAYTADVTVNIETGASPGTAGISDIENIAGGSGDDRMVGPDVDTTWIIDGTDAGQVAGVNFSGFENLTGGTGADTFLFTDGSSLSGMIDGGGGINTLDYSAYTTDVIADLEAETATGTGGVNNIQNVTGGGGSDTLTGDVSSNILVGGAGDDVLTGGTGADTLDGGAGTDTLTEARDADFILSDTALSIGLEGTDVLSAIEEADFTGAASANTLDASGFTGTLSFAGEGESDTFIAGLGLFTFHGGSGSDTLIAADTTNTWQITAQDAGTLNGNTFTSIENLIGGALGDTFILAAGAMTSGLIDGRLGQDRLKGGDTANNWVINALNAGMFNGKPFKDIESLEGGADADVFAFTNGSVDSLDGGAGADTLDYSADTAGVVVDLATGATSYASSVVDIETMVTGAGDDTIIGALSAVLLDTGAGTDTLDFAGVGSDLTISVHADGTVSVTDGLNAVSNVGGVENIVSGSGKNTIVFEDGASLAGTISGAGHTVLDYSSYSADVTVNLATGEATGTAGVSNVVNVLGGGGSDTLVGPGANAAWSITGVGSGSVSGVLFSNLENLVGGSGADSFVFSGGSVVSVDGSAGADTLDLSADFAGVSVDLSAGTATYAGSVTDIENVVTGAGDDTIIGALTAVILDTGAGLDTLDFSGVTSDLTVTIHTDGTISVTEGVNNVFNISGAENIVTGSGHNTLVLEDGASLAGSITGAGTVSLDYSAYTTDVTVNLAAGTATGTAGVSNITTVIVGSGNDTLIGPENDATWNIVGLGSGTVAGVTFTGIENLTGAADNQDTFVFTEEGSISGIVEGGASGFDSLVVNGGNYADVIYTVTGPDSGRLRLDDTIILFRGMEPVDLTGTAAVADFLFELNTPSGSGSTSFDDLIRLRDRVTAGQMEIISDSSPMTFEEVWFNNPTNSLTINAEGGNDTITIESVDTNFAASILLEGGVGADTIVGPDSTNTWTITGAGAGNVTDSVNFSFTDMEILNGGSGDDTLIGRDSDTTWNITDTNEGNISDGGSISFDFAGFENLTGGSGQDDFVFEDGDGVTGTVEGGSGTNTLDYTAYSAGVNVNLDTGTATGTSGASNIRNVTGGSGNDSVTGDSANNRLEGNAGDDTLTGGGGDDTYPFGDDWGDDTLADSGGTAFLDFSEFTGTLQLQAADPEVKGLVGGSIVNTVDLDLSGDATFTTDIAILTTHSEEGELTDGLLALSDLGDELDKLDKLDTPLLPYATAGMTIGGFLDIGGILYTRLSQQLENYLSNDTGGHTLDELVGILNQSGTIGDLQYAVDAVATLAGGVLTIDLGLNAARTISGIDLRMGPEMEEFLIADVLTGEFTTTLNWDFSVGVDAGGAFFGNFDNDISVGAEINLVPNAHFTAHRGFLGLDVTSLGIDSDNTALRVLKADLTVDPGGLDTGLDGSVSLTELQSPDLNSLTQAGTGKVGFNLDVQPTTGVQGVSTASLTFQDDLFDGIDPLVTDASGFDDSITDFDNTDAGTVLAVLQQFGKSLGIFGTKALNLPIALTDGQSVGDLFDLGALFQQQVLDRLEQQPHTASTPVSELNRDRGVRTMTGLPDMEVQLSDGTTFQVNLDHDPVSGTLGDLMQLIRDAATAAGLGATHFEVDIDPERGGLRLIDKTGGTGEFNVAAMNFSPALLDLGLEGPGEVDPDNPNQLVIAADIGFPGPNFDTVQGMLGNLGLIWINGPAVYDSSTHGLGLDLSIDLTGPAVNDAGMALFDMGPLTDLVTASKAELTPTGALTLPLELLLTPVGFATSLSDSTDLSLLNAGDGVGTNGLETITSTVNDASNPATGIGELVATSPVFGLPDSLVGRTLEITSGVAQGETLTIVANTPDTLTLDGEWTTIPGNGDSFFIDGSDLEVQLRDGTIFTVELDGVSAPTTVGDIKALFKAAGGPDFDIRIAEDRLILVDRTTPLPSITGTVTSASTGSDLEDTNANFGSDDSQIGRTVEITGGTGSGQIRKIGSNTATTLTVDFDWDTPPDTTSDYIVFSTFEVLARNDSPARNDLGLISAGSEQVITADTLVSDANGLQGLGTNGTTATDLRVTLSNGSFFEVDLDVLPPDATMGDLMQLIQDAATTAGVNSTEFEAWIDPGTGRLSLVDRTGALGFSVSDVNGATAASELGLVSATPEVRDVDHDGTDEYVIDFAAGPAFTLEGNVLHGDTASAHMGVRLGGDNLTLNVAMDDGAGIDITAGLWGALGVTAAGGDLVSGSVDVDMVLGDPGTDAGTDNLLTVREFNEGLGTVTDLIDTLTPRGSFELDLPLLPSPGFAGVVGSAATLNVTLPDMTDLSTLALSFTAPNDVKSLLEAVHDLTIADVVSALNHAADYLILLQDQALLGSLDNLLAYRLPGLDRSLSEILAFGQGFKDQIAMLADGVEDPQKLQDLEDALNALSDLSATLTFDISSSELTFDLAFTPSVTTQLPFRLDLTKLGVDLATLELDTIGVIQDWTHSDPVTATASATIDFDLVMDLQAVDSSDPLGARNETPYIKSMNSTFDIQVDDSDLNFPSSLGSLSVDIVGGSFHLDEDGAGAGTNPATYSVSLPSGSYSIADGTEIAIAANDTSVMLAGKLDIVLPMVFPEEIPPNQEPVTLTISDLGNALPNTTLLGPPVRSLQGLVSLLDNLDSFPGSFAELFTQLDAAFDEAIFAHALPLVGSQLAEAVDFIEQIRDKVLANLRLITPGLTPKDVQQALFEALGPGGLGWLADKDGNLHLNMDDIDIPILSDTQIEFELDLVLPPQILATPVDLDLALPGLGLEIEALVDVVFGLADGDASSPEFDPITLVFGMGGAGAYIRPSSFSQVEFDLDVSLRSAVALTGTPNLTFKDNGTLGPDTITRDAGSWILDGFKVGQIFTVGTTPGGNQGEYEVAAIDPAGLTLTLAPGDALSTEGPVKGINIEVNKVTLTGNPNLTFKDDFFEFTDPNTGQVLFRQDFLDTIERDGGNWIADGFRRGQTITVANAGGNSGTYEILRIDPTGTTLFLAPDSLSDAGPASGITVQSNGHQGFEAKMGFLPFRAFDLVDVDPAATDPTRLSGTYTISLNDTSGSMDDPLFATDLTGAMVAASLDGSADINLRLETDLPDGAAFPPYRVDFLADWDFTASDPVIGDSYPAMVKFDNVQFELVGFMRDFVGSALSRLEIAFNPLDGLVDFLNSAAFPILSLIFGRAPYATAATFHGGRSEIGDFAGASEIISRIVYGGDLVKDPLDWLNPLSKEPVPQSLIWTGGFLGLGRAPSAVQNVVGLDYLSGQAWIDVGSFEIDPVAARDNSVAEDGPPTAINVNAREFGKVDDDPGTILGDIRHIAMTQSTGAGDAALGFMATQLLPGRTNAIGDIFGGAIRFFFKGTDPIEVPILNDPGDGTAVQSFDLILGHTVIGNSADEESSRLLNYGTPELFVLLYQDIPLSKKEIAKKVFKSGALGEALTAFGIDIFAYLAIAFEARADFQIEYDTTGLKTYGTTGNPYDIVDGLFFNDAEGVDERSITGGTFSALHDEDQSRILGGLGLGVAVQFNLAVLKFRLGIEGIVFIGEGRDFNDPNNDLKLRAHEFDALLLAKPAPLRSFEDNIYNIGIASEFRLDVFAKVFLQFFFFKLTIFDFRANLLTLQPPNIPLPSTSIDLPELATESGSDLVLAIGDNDPKTIYVGFDEESDQFVVSRMSYTNTYNYATRQFDVSSPDPAAEYSRNYFRTYPAAGIERIIGSGGTGNDTIIVSPKVMVPVEFHGDGGNDVLIGGGGPATLYGEGGEDYLQAGSGGGTFYGGDNDDIIVGGDAVDIIHGGLGDDRLLGWRGDDAIYGDEGQDLIDGGSGNDYIHGGSGNDVVLGGLDDDHIHGGSGNDNIEGGDGQDRIFGDEGDDIIRGGYGNDEIDGGIGADDIFGQQNNDLIYGGADNDWLDGGGATDVIFGDSGPKPASGPEGDDVIVSRQGDDFLDGEGGDDTYLVSFQGGLTASLVTVLDTGSPQSGTDVFVATGTIFDDQFLLRANTDGSLAFVAMLNDPVDKVERINYTGVERVVVNAGDGEDHFAVDDTAAEVTINGEAGDDTFQIGQIFRSQRTEVQANVSVEDEFATIETTRGFLSNGISAPMTINGGAGIDNFVVFHNKAVLTLNGDEGDDVFEVRAFALAGSQEPQRERTDISGGAGADLVQYAVNAPVNIDGGDGLDTLVVFGTEFGDDFVITEDGVFGAGLTINFVNIELLKVDGAEGDDRFFVKSTSEKFITELYGGLGSDTFNMSGDTPPVVSNDLLGHSGIILHDVESNDPTFDGQKLFGISANVADNDEPFVVVRQTDGSTIITEGGSLVDTYEVVLTRQPDTDVFIKALAPIPTPDERELRARAFRLSSPSPSAVTTPDGTGLTLTFTAANWFIPQVVEVRADGETVQDTAGLFTRPELGDSPSFNFDDDAYEGVQFGVINHLVLAGSRSVQGYPVAITPSPTLTIPIPGPNLADYIPSKLVGRTVTITSGDGAGQERVVVAAEIDATAGEITLILDRAWLVSDVPTTTSGFELPLASGDVTGNPLAVTNPTVTISDPGAITPAELLGRRLEIVSGSGAGQSRFIVGAEDQGDGTFMLTLDRGWLVTDLPSAGKSSEQTQTQTGNVFAPNVLTFEFDVGSLGPAGDGVLTVSAIADLDLTTEYLTLNAEGVLSQDLFVSGGQQYSPVATTVNLTQNDLQTLAYDGKITLTVTPSTQVNDLSSFYGPSTLTLQLSFPEPDSEFLLRIDDAFVGTMTAFNENAFPDPDGRSTFTDSDATFPTVGEGLTGAILQIVGGPGAGQQRLILGNLGSDPMHTLILNGPWRTDPVPGESVYRIERYDGLAIPSVQVQINDNDAAGLIIDETQGFESPDTTVDPSDVVDDFDTITAVIEGGNGDHLGEKDVLRVRLSRDPGATAVDISLLFDGSQLELTKLDGTPISSLQFDSSNWSDFQTVVVEANDDMLREGFHTSLIEFNITAGESDTTMTQTDSFETIPEDEAVFFVGLSQVPLQGTVLVTLNGNLLAENTDYLVKGNKVIFVDANGEEMTRSGEIEVTYDYIRPGFLGTFTTPVLVRINDNDAPTVLVRETDGSTDVIEALPQPTERSIELLTNGSFETGFNGWATNIIGTPLIPWRVTGGGFGSGFGMARTSPQDGSFVAWNGFDGSGPMEFQMFQDVTISDEATATLTWQDRVQWDFRLGGFADQPRLYDVEVRDPNTGTVLGTLYSYSTETQDINSTGDTSWQTHTADLSAFAGQTIRLFFREQIPQYFTGPAQIEFDAISLTETSVAAISEDDTYELVLTGKPAIPVGGSSGDGTVTVTVTPEITKTTRTGGIRHDDIQVAISSSDSRVVKEMVGGIATGNLIVTFDDTNWDDPVLITVKAIDDDFVDGGDTKVFAPGPNTLSGILGPVFVEGGGGEGSLGIPDPVMLPGETNIKEKTGDVVSVSGTQVTVSTADLNAILSDLGLTQLSELVDKTIEITAVTDPTNLTHSAIGQFRLITDVASGANPGETVLTINEPYDLQPGESWSDIKSYAITAESLNFFVDESTQIDYMFVHDKDSPADSNGVLTSTRLSGLNMGPDLVFNGQRRPGGITYGDLEVLEINLGTGGNNFEVLGTHTREDGYQTWTFLNTGDDIPFQGIVGDTVTVILNDQEEVTASGTVTTAQNPGPGIYETTVTIEGSFADGALAGQVIRIVGAGSGDPSAVNQTRRILGNTDNVLTVDRPWEFIPTDTTYEIINEADGAFALNTQVGDDIVDASASTLPLVIFGGDGSDVIAGGLANDLIFGDNGRVDYFDETGMIVTRLGMIRDDTLGNGQPNTGYVDSATANTLKDNDVTFPIEDGGLAGLTINIINGQGAPQKRRIVSNTVDTITVDSDWDAGKTPDATSQYRISFIPEDQTDGEVREPLFLITTPSGSEGDDTLYGGPDEDVLMGGGGGDTIDGGTERDLIFGDEVKLDRIYYDSNGDMMPSPDFTSPRFRALQGTVIYGLDDLDQVDDNTDYLDPDHLDPTVVPPLWGNWDIFMNDAWRFDFFGNDYIAGGPADDMIFGQLGDDTIQGDGSVLLNVSADRGIGLVVQPSIEDLAGFDMSGNQIISGGSDGDDYIEGNGGNDVIFGNLGQDDIIGGSSSLFSLTDPAQRDDGSDVIFGGAGTDISRNNPGDVSNEGHAEDADMILGDNGNIFRLVGTNSTGIGAYLTFNYDDPAFGYSNILKIIPRAVELLDYHPGGLDYDPTQAPHPASNDLGAGDEIHGESGDDVIYGMKGADVLFGEGQDDDLIGGYGNDWISGGTGQDGVIGDDGRIYTSRNGTAEPLYGIGDLAGELNREISTPGNIQQATIHVPDVLKKTVNLTPFKLGDPNEPQYVSYDPQAADDIIYGGWDDDFLHGGDGDDAISGAEALPMYYDAPLNLGDVLKFGVYGAGEFGAYDEYHPWSKVYWDPATGEFVTGGSIEFLLNFDHLEGPNVDLNDPGSAHTDGDDVVFGDLGNDWLVGGTGRDHLYGGRGSDLLNADDNHDTQGGANTAADGPEASYEDIAYGGAGRDVLIANTGGDRLIDWAGEFNSYIVPYAPFGFFTVSRAPQPQLYEFLYDLAWADGSDPTIPGDTGADPTRRGEPEGELGLVTQRDVDWREQTGAPDDPQPGNIPGGARDILRSATFNSGNMEAFAPDTGIWTVENGALRVSAESLGGDAVSVFHVGDMLPQYFEIQATITMEKPTAGWKANSYVIFDYYSPTDFKFAGLNASIDKIQIGHRDETGWIVDVQSNMRVKPGEFYNILVAVNGTTVTVLADNKEYFSHTFAPRVDKDGWVYGINSGMVGFGSDNSRGVYDNIAVQVLPPEITFQGTEEFPDSDAAIGVVPSIGNWEMLGGRYNGSPAAEDTTAISLVDLGLGHGFEVASVLEMETTLNTESMAGLVFDYYGPKDFKFAAIDAVADKVFIGHSTSKGGWVYDATFDIAIEAGVDYDLNLSLKGSTVNLSVKEAKAKNWQAMVGHVYNAVTVDGDFGLLSKDGASSFDEVTVKTNDPAFRDEGNNLMASAAPNAFHGEVSLLTEDALDAIVDEAIERWTEVIGIDEALLASLYDVSFQIVDFNDLTLGRAIGDTVLIDAEAAGYGWFVDDTPYDSVEFGLELSEVELMAAESSVAFDSMDLLTVVMHELGHVLGFQDLDAESHDLMSETLDAGVRKLPGDTSRTDDTSPSLISMESAEEGAETDPTPQATMASNHSGWLRNFLVGMEKDVYNPFEPKDKIRIVISDNDEEEG